MSRALSQSYSIQRYGIETLENLSLATNFNRWMYELFEKELGDEILEIGCGIGNISQHLPTRHRLVLTDHNGINFKYLRHLFRRKDNVQIERLDIASHARAKERASQFDSVICLNVLEHIREHETALLNILTTLKPGGKLFLLVPQYMALYGTFDKQLDHCRRYSKPQLRSLLKSCGFSLERMRDFNFLGIFGWYLNGRILKKAAISTKQIKLYDHLVPVMKPLEKILPLPGLSLFCVAQRPI